MSKFYTLCQNNSGGYVIQDDNVDKFIIIEANNLKQFTDKANELLKNKRAYCPCCGERWDDEYLDEEDADDEPSIWGQPIKNFYLDDEEKYWNGHPTIIHYLNGRVKRYTKEDAVNE